MGKLFYGSSEQPIEIPDRLLAHLRAVATTKLRRGESFTLTWIHPDDIPGGRSTIWLQPAIQLRFVFASSELEELDTPYLQQLAKAANSSAGLTVDLRPALENSPAGARSGVVIAA